MSAESMAWPTLTGSHGTNDKTTCHASERKLPDFSDTSPSDHRAYRWIRHISVTLWVWETLSLLTSMACIGAIMGLLAHYNGRQLPNWSYGLTINGVISILAVIAKSAMVLPIAEAISQLKWCWFWDRERPVLDFESFDSASRGPWGSLTMLFRVRLWSFGAVGAALTLASLVFEPSLQQIPAYPNRLVGSGTASMNRCVNYSDADPLTKGLGWALGSTSRGAITVGSYKNSVSPYEPTCPTGNCTWPQYSSLGVCSACHNLTVYPMVVDSPWIEVLDWVIRNYGDKVDDNNAKATGVNTALYLQANMNRGLDNSVAYRGSFNQSIANIMMMYWPPGLSGTGPPSGAFECILYFCVKTYSGRTISGEFQESVTSVWPGANETLKEPDISPFELTYVTNFTNFRLTHDNYTLQPPGQQETYTVDRITYNLLRWFTKSAFRGAITTMTSTGIMDGEALDGYDLAETLYAELTSRLGPNQTIDTGPVGQNHSVFNYTVPTTGGPDRFFEQMATSLTSHMRQAADPSAAVAGEALSVQTFVSARWEWAVLPIVLLCSTLVFLVVTITTSARRGVPAWKSSSLAVLLHGLDEQSCEALTAAKLDVMESNAGSWDMEMHRKAHTWILEGKQH